MTGIYKRQRRLYVFGGIVLMVAVVNLLFYLILYRPAQSDYFHLRSSISSLRTETALRKLAVAQKERTIAQLETSNEDKQKLFTAHFIPRSVGFAEVLPALDAIAQKTGVRWTTANYSPDPEPQYGMFSVKIKYPVQGGYPNIVNFIKELENSQTFYIITALDVRSGTESSQQQAPSPSGTVSLSLSLEAFFYQ